MTVPTGPWGPVFKGSAVTDKRFHLGWFTPFGTTAWDDPIAQAEEPWDGQFYVEMAKSLERACFDLIMLEDSLSISAVHGGSMEAYLRHGMMAPKNDPAPLAALIGASTSRLGIVSTLSTLAYPPFMLARLCSTLDHISHGRFGWNIVTSATEATAHNFGLDRLPPREERYDMADEYVALVKKLFESWEPDAVVRDHATHTYADAAKVRAVNFEGKYFRCAGPLNTVRCPQGRPAFLQAGGSPRGRRFAATHADCIVAFAGGPKGMKAYRDDVRAKALAAGRDPDEIKVLFLVAPILAATRDEAVAREEREFSADPFVEAALALFGSLTDIDLSAFDLDAVLPYMTTNGEQGALDTFGQWGSGKTLRQLAKDSGTSSSVRLVGTPESVADEMAAVMEEAGGDGFLIITPLMRVSRRYIGEITEGLVPALQRRGLVRSEYTRTTLRGHLLEF
jgi:FMN-dependent oxidoreductase (nitrilotriacetate monooxygenase family)